MALDFVGVAEPNKLYRKERKGNAKAAKKHGARFSYLATLLARSRMALSVNAACWRM